MLRSVEPQDGKGNVGVSLSWGKYGEFPFSDVHGPSQVQSHVVPGLMPRDFSGTRKPR